MWFHFMVSFLSSKVFRGNLSEAILSAEIDVTLKVTSILTNKIASFRCNEQLREYLLECFTYPMQP